MIAVWCAGASKATSIHPQQLAMHHRPSCEPSETAFRNAAGAKAARLALRWHLFKATCFQGEICQIKATINDKISGQNSLIKAKRIVSAMLRKTMPVSIQTAR